MVTGTRSSRNGQAMLEVLVVAITFLIPLVLFAVDVFCCLAANSMVDHYTKIAARAAASQPTQEKADEAVAHVVNKFPRSGMFTNFQATVQHTPPNPSTPGVQGVVVVDSTIAVKLPVPIPFLNTEPTFQARAVEPITALAPAPKAD